MYISHISLQSICCKIAKKFAIDTNNDDNRVHPEHFCLSCKGALDRAISAMHKNIHYKRSTAPFQWEMHSDLECKVGDYTCAHIKYEVLLLYRCVSTIMKVQEAHLQKEQKNCTIPGINPNMIIGCVNKTAPPPVISREHPDPRLPLPKHNLSVLNQFEYSVFLDIVTQPMELPCKAMACAQCIIHWVAMHIKLASNVVLLMLKDVLVYCRICTRDMRAAMYEHHECTPSLTHEGCYVGASWVHPITYTWRLLCRSIMSAPHHLHMKAAM